jgi:hypothetical protein
MCPPSVLGASSSTASVCRSTSTLAASEHCCSHSLPPLAMVPRHSTSTPIVALHVVLAVLRQLCLRRLAALHRFSWLLLAVVAALCRLRLCRLAALHRLLRLLVAVVASLRQLCLCRPLSIDSSGFCTRFWTPLVDFSRGLCKHL